MARPNFGNGDGPPNTKNGEPVKPPTKPPVKPASVFQVNNPWYSPPKPPKPAPVQSSGGGGGNSGGGGYGGGGGGGGGGSYVAPSVAPVVAAPSEQDYLAGDDLYTNTVGALKRALEDYQANYKADLDEYNIDYGNSLKNLGYTPGQEPGGAGGEWNWTDPLTASGKAATTQTNDFASRGLLQSSGYVDAFDTLKRSLGDQFTSMLGAKNDYQSDMDRGLTEYKSQNTTASQNARAEAIARMAAQYGLT